MPQHPLTAKLTELMELLGRADPTRLTPGDMVKIQQLTAAGQIDADHLLALLRVNATATMLMQLDLQETVPGQVSNFLQSASDSQRAALEALYSWMNDAHFLLQNIEDPAEAAELSAEFNRTAGEVAGRIEQINRDNNRLWQKTTATAAMTVTGLATLAAVYLLNRAGQGEA